MTRITTAAVLSAGTLVGVGVLVDHRLAEAHPLHAQVPAVPRRNVAAPAPNLLDTAQITSFLSTRTSQVTMALYDAVTGRTYLYRPDVTQQTASIEKVTILATLLHQHQQDNTPLDPATVDLATTMIVNSNDDAASALWAQVGSAGAVAAFDKTAGLTDTKPAAGGLLGETTTTAADQVRMVRDLVYPGTVLNPASQAFALNLMENLEADQRWGISAGVSSGVTIALKDGWEPLVNYYDWQVNSVGWVDGDGRNYVLAVLSDNNDGEQYGIDTIAGIAPLVWDELAPHNPSPTGQTLAP
jgi:hypothetical protein